MEAPDKKSSHGLQPAEIRKLVNKYIGVKEGYLGDFSYQKHADFYADLNLDIDPNQYPGTTRLRFEQILTESRPEIQARIVEGILDRYAVGSSPNRTPALYEEVRSWIDRLNSRGTVQIAPPTLTTDIVRRALTDAEHLIKASGAPSAVDRVHTALHGYLLNVCSQAQITVPTDASMSRLLKLIRQEHPRLSSQGARAEDIGKLLNSLATILDVLNPIRNYASVAHPNSNLLLEPEAILVVNAARTVLNYLDAKLTAQ